MPRYWRGSSRRGELVLRPSEPLGACVLAAHDGQTVGIGMVAPQMLANTFGQTHAKSLSNG